MVEVLFLTSTLIIGNMIKIEVSEIFILRHVSYKKGGKFGKTFRKYKNITHYIKLTPLLFIYTLMQQCQHFI